MTRDTLADTAKSTASSVADSLMEGGRSALADVRHRATDAASRATEAARAEAMDRAESAKTSLAQEGDRLAQTLRQAVDGGDDSIQARVLSVVADSVDELTASLRNRSFPDLLDDAQAFARRNPGAFVAAAALAGFALARFARASTPAPAYDSDYDRSYDTGYDPTQPAVSQGYSTMPSAGAAASYGSTSDLGSGLGSGSGAGSGYGSSEGASFGASSYAGSSVSTHGMTTGGDLDADGTGAADRDAAGLGPMADDDLADEDTPNRPSSTSTGVPT